MTAVGHGSVQGVGCLCWPRQRLEVFSEGVGKHARGLLEGGRGQPGLGSQRCLGLKENVIIGKLIPAGTGMSRFQPGCAYR